MQDGGVQCNINQENNYFQALNHCNLVSRAPIKEHIISKSQAIPDIKFHKKLHIWIAQYCTNTWWVWNFDEELPQMMSNCHGVLYPDLIREESVIEI